MRFTLAAAAIVGLAAASGNSTASDVWVTDVVTAFTTYCPYATQLTYGTNTYTVTEATTLTVTDCPCTITKPATSTAAMMTPKVMPTGGAKPSGSAPVGGAKPSGTSPAGTTSTLTPFKGAADKVSVGVAGVLAVAGLVAAL